MPPTALSRVHRNAAARKTLPVKSQVKSPAKMKSESLSMRIDEQTRTLIDRAADALGQSRTEFVLASARERATEVVLDRSLFVADDSDWSVFVQALDEAPVANAKLRALLTRNTPWEGSRLATRRKRT